MANKAIVYVDFPGGETSFVDIINTPNGPGMPRLTPATFTLDAPIPDVIDQNPPSGGKSGNLMIFDKVNIEFQLAIGYGFRPAGIAFKQTMVGVGGADSNGRDNLPKSKVVIVDDPRKVPSIEVSNDFKQKRARWNILLLIQNSVGQLGVLDPEIENSSESYQKYLKARNAKK